MGDLRPALRRPGIRFGAARGAGFDGAVKMPAAALQATGLSRTHATLESNFAAFGALLEAAVQSVDPSVAVPFWASEQATEGVPTKTWTEAFAADASRNCSGRPTRPRACASKAVGLHARPDEGRAPGRVETGRRAQIRGLRRAPYGRRGRRRRGLAVRDAPQAAAVATDHHHEHGHGHGEPPPTRTAARRTSLFPLFVLRDRE